MNADQRAQKRCKRHEGLRLSRYECSTGHMTIGYGHRLAPGEEFDEGIPAVVADQLFAGDWEGAGADLQMLFIDHRIPNRGEVLGPDRVGALQEMVFQLGRGGAGKFRRMWAALNIGDYQRAAMEMLDSRWHRQTPARCEVLAEIIRTGLDPR